jgi:hypothetical protein
MKTTRGVTVRVLEVPRFDTSAITYGQTMAPERQRTRDTFIAPIMAAAALAVALVGVLAILHRVRPARAVHRLLSDIGHRASQAGDQTATARALTAGLVEYLALTIDRPRGALTPSEAVTGVLKATGSDALAARAGRLLHWCDERLYDGTSHSVAGVAAFVVGKNPDPLFLHDLAKETDKSTIWKAHLGDRNTEKH